MPVGLNSTGIDNVHCFGTKEVEDPRVEEDSP